MKSLTLSACFFMLESNSDLEGGRAYEKKLFYHGGDGPIAYRCRHG